MRVVFLISLFLYAVFLDSLIAWGVVARGVAKEPCFSTRFTMINRSTEDWTAKDRAQAIKSKTVCYTHYNQCILRFYKLGFQNWYVTCGK